MITLISSIFLFFVLNLIFPFKPYISYSTLVSSSDGRVMGAYLSADDKWRMDIQFGEMSTELKEAFLLKEDAYFYSHPGINPVSLVRALFQNISSGKRVSGASTITMQVARLLEPKERSYGNKIIEIFRALQLELNYSKDEILQMYLNLVPYGGNIEGVKAASVLYLGKLPQQLSPSEISILTIVPNRPNSLGVRSGELEKLRKSRDSWLKYYASKDWIDEDDLEYALAEPIEFRRRELEFTAPHLCRRLAQNYPGKADIKSSISYSLQQKTQALVANYVQRLSTRQISNSCVLIIDNSNSKVLSYVGSADFEDYEHQGEVDGVQAVRSPGSTLKPLLYAFAMEKGLFTPKSVLTDVPSNFNGYTPENYDMDFKGAITVSFALAHSLNIPAVKVLHEAGIRQFTDFLIKGGFKQIKKDKKKLGLSLILGGCGVSLEELATMYQCMANQGVYRDLNFLEENSGGIEFPLLSAEAAFMTSDMLSKLQRPDIPDSWSGGKTLPHIAWKTGTSYGRKDAWSVGYNDRFTVAVWLGNFDASGVPDLSGAEIASPLLFEIFENLPGSNRDKWLIAAPKIGLRKVCANSGQVPSEDCENIVIDYHIPGVSSSLKCRCKKKVWVNDKETISYCRSCKPSDGVKLKAYRTYSPDLISWYEIQSYPYEYIPPHYAKCERIFQEGNPEITSPTDGAEYLLEKGSDQQIQLMANVGNEVEWMYWYVNDKYKGKSKRGEGIFVKLNGGDYKISCADDKGRSSHIRIKILRF